METLFMMFHNMFIGISEMECVNPYIELIVTRVLSSFVAIADFQGKQKFGNHVVLVHKNCKVFKK